MCRFSRLQISYPQVLESHLSRHSHLSGEKCTNYHSTWYGLYTWPVQWESNPRDLDLGSSALTTQSHALLVTPGLLSLLCSSTSCLIRGGRLQVNRSRDLSCTWGMIHIKFGLISPGSFSNKYTTLAANLHPKTFSVPGPAMTFTADLWPQTPFIHP